MRSKNFVPQRTLLQSEHHTVQVLVRYYPLFQFVGKVLPVAITILGGISVMNGNMSLGALVAYVEYSRNCTWPMEMMGWLTNDLSSAVASYKKSKRYMR